MDNPQNMDAESTIIVTKKSGRSLYMFILQHLIKPFGPSLVKPKKAFPSGSPKLEVPKKTRKLCRVDERLVEDIHLYDFHPRDEAAEESKTKRKRILFFCGGSWQMPPSPEHWALCTEIARKLPNNAKLSIVSYPLAPNSPAPIAFPQLMKMYKRLVQEAEDNNEEVILIGDSSGGNIILCLTLAQLAEDENAPCPTSLMAICPSTDMRKQNPDMVKVEKHDPLLRIPSVTNNAVIWRGEWDAADPRVSPLLADVSSLERRGIKVNGLTGGYDVLGPDALLFRDKCEQAKVKGEWLHWEKQMHCFPLSWNYKLPESVWAKDWILEVLKRS